MRRPSVKLLVGVCSLGLVLVVGLLDLRRTAPGALSAMHARVPELAGANACAACHGGLFTSVTEACLDCHGAIDAQIASSAGLHGGLDRSEAVRCVTCHSEHHGEAFPMVNAASFARAGVDDVEAFDHVLVGFVMDGAHLERDCTACHEHARDDLPPEGTPRFGGLSRDCAACHADPHEGRMTVDCVRCHGQRTWDGLGSLGHGDRLPLVGGHADVACATCHVEGTSHGLEALGTRGSASLDARMCAVCHASPHDPGFVRDVGLVTSRPAGDACAACHLAGQTLFRSPDVDVPPALHALTGFALDAPHAAVACDACHGVAGTFAERFPGRPADDCRACHADPHGGQFDASRRTPGDCLACHARDGFVPPRFDADAHAATALPLDGAHAALTCEACHERPAPDAPRAFAGTPARCEDCHADAHDGAFDARLVAQPDDPRGTCARCHSVERFDDPLPGGFVHGAWTGLVLDGAHLQVGCETCHPATHASDDAGRRFGRVADHVDVARGCAACHADVHEGAFERPGLARSVDGRTDCARCHDATSFRSLPDGFDHRRWTGFALTGRHEQSACSACHVPRAPDGDGRTWSHAVGSRCADCHVDPHAGQFRVDDATDCARCHRAAATFADLRFDHETDARFALGDAHSGLSCAACHPTVEAGMYQVVRWRPLSGACVDCHGVQESVLLARRAGGAR